MAGNTPALAAIEIVSLADHVERYTPGQSGELRGLGVFIEVRPVFLVRTGTRQAFLCVQPDWRTPQPGEHQCSPRGADHDPPPALPWLVLPADALRVSA